ncbi:MAG: universal stress protein [Pyrinomonadaceae bacterium]|nr:universal stress protein [Pyrinomonadaceae bacterium]
MAATISRKLSNSFEGALAGGGDPATSPLYVFGPLLKLIVIAGVAKVTFGATIWLTVFTVIMVSAMYRQVMSWITDGSGGSGLAEEEFGGWAVKINAGITVIEYTLTFLVSMAALVTFVADRAYEFGIPINGALFGIPSGYKIAIAIGLSFFTGWLVNRGPKVSARAFGPATAGVLGLLWVMIFATIYQFGINLPVLDLQAFSTEAVRYVSEAGEQIETSFLNLTLGGYARILALMTGIEIFANLVAAYEGRRAEKSRKAFGSLIIIMGTTALTMIIVGPAILRVSADTVLSEVSVFTQTMNAILPAWASYLGTLIGIAVLLSACAAAAQGVQNLALGLRYRHYIAADLGQRNKYDVAGKPVWIMIAVIAVCFVLFGTHEETYLALYAAGVFILLSMTGWAASKRLLRELRESFSVLKLASLVGTMIASALTSIATVIIFEERFYEGAWLYFVLIPALYVIFSYYRGRLGKPPSVEERLGAILTMQKYSPTSMREIKLDEIPFKKIVVPLDGSSLAEQVIPTARAFARAYGAELEFVAVEPEESGEDIEVTESEKMEHRSEIKRYIGLVSDLITGDGLDVEAHYRYGDPATEINSVANETNSDLIIMSTRGKFDISQLVSASMAQRVVQGASAPTLLIRPTNNWRSRRSEFKRILIALDGSEEAEMVLPYIRAFAMKFNSRVLLVSVPEGSESEGYSEKLKKYLDSIAENLKEEGLEAFTHHTGSGPARTILAVSEDQRVDLIMMASHGRGGVVRAEKVPIGSVAEKVVKETMCPVFLLPLHKIGSVIRDRSIGEPVEAVENTSEDADS